MNIQKTIHTEDNKIIMNFSTELTIKEFTDQIQRHTTRESVVLCPVSGMLEVFDKGQLITSFKFIQ